MNKYPHGIKLAAVCRAIDAYKAHEDDVPEIGILKAFEVLLGDSELSNKLLALAAENATIKTMNDVLSEELRGYESDGAYDGPIAHKLWHSNSETPATDAYLNSVRADGVEMFAVHQRAMIGKPHKNDAATSYAARCAVEYAAQLRAGKDGE